MNINLFLNKLSYYYISAIMVILSTIFSPHLSFGSELILQNKPMCNDLGELIGTFNTLSQLEKNNEANINQEEVNHINEYCSKDVFQINSKTPFRKKLSSVLSALQSSYCKIKIVPYKANGINMLEKYKKIITTYKNFLSQNESILTPFVFGYLHELADDEMSEASKNSHMYLSIHLEQFQSLQSSRIREKILLKEKKSYLDYFKLGTTFLKNDIEEEPQQSDDDAEFDLLTSTLSFSTPDRNIEFIEDQFYYDELLVLSDLVLLSNSSLCTEKTPLERNIGTY